MKVYEAPIVEVISLTVTESIANVNTEDYGNIISK